MAEIKAIREPDSTEKFWQQVIQKQGKVLAFSLTQYQCMDSEHYASLVPTRKRTIKGQHWGICYGTENALYFYHFQQSSILGSVLGQQKNKEFCICLPYAEIESWHLRASQRNGIVKWIKASERVLAITGLAQNADEYIIGKAAAAPHTSNASVDPNTCTSQFTTQGVIFSKHAVHLFYLDFHEQDILQLLRMLIPKKEATI